MRTHWRSVEIDWIRRHILTGKMTSEIVVLYCSGAPRNDGSVELDGSLCPRRELNALRKRVQGIRQAMALADTPDPRQLTLDGGTVITMNASELLAIKVSLETALKAVNETLMARQPSVGS